MEFTTDDIYVYIFSWRKVTENAIRLYDAVSPHFKNTFFVNCDQREKIPREKVIQLDDRYFYGGQFEASLKATPKGKIMGCIVGDVEPEAPWELIAKKATAAFQTGRIGVYAPNVDITEHTSRQHNVGGDLFSVVNTDCTCWFIHPDMLCRIRYMDVCRLTNIGWGIDYACCEESRRQGKFVVRDYSVLVKQPKGTAYSKENASRQFKDFMREYTKRWVGSFPVCR